MSCIKYYTLFFIFLYVSCSTTKNSNYASDSTLSAAQKNKMGTEMNGRVIIHRDNSMLKAFIGLHGKAIFNICINQKGKVIAVEYNTEKSTIRNQKNIQKGIEAMYKYKYEADPNAPLEQCGNFKVVIETKKGIHEK